MKYKRITENRKRAALLGELAVYFEEGIRAPRAPEGVPSISTWLRTVRDPIVAGFFEASHATFKALESAGSPTADRMAVRAARHILWELREYAAASIVGAEGEGEVGLALPSRITPVEPALKVEADAGPARGARRPRGEGCAVRPSQARHGAQGGGASR